MDELRPAPDDKCCDDALHVRSRFIYDPQSGALTFKHPRRGTPPDRLVGSLTTKGYRKFRIFGRMIGVHRLAWLHFYGQWPQHHIDHINGDKLDNRIANLRDIPSAHNTQNRLRPLSNNRSGILGVWVRRGRYRAAIEVNDRTISLGTYDTPEEAQAAYFRAKAELHPGYVPPESFQQTERSA